PTSVLVRRSRPAAGSRRCGRPSAAATRPKADRTYLALTLLAYHGRRVRASFAALFVLVAVLALAPSAPAASDKAWTAEAKAARTALQRSAAAGYVTAGEEARYLGILAHARIVRNRVPPGRAKLLDAVLALVSRPKSPTASRALILYTTLQANADYLASHRIPSG